MNVRLRMYQVLLFKFRRHLCKGVNYWFYLYIPHGFVFVGCHCYVQINSAICVVLQEVVPYQ